MSIRGGRVVGSRALDQAGTRPSSVASGSAVSPVCTAEGWTMVLLGDAIQWNRSAGGSEARGPASASPAHSLGMSSRCDLMRSTSAPGAICSSSGTSRSMRAARNRCGRHSSTMPALSRSPRSTSGTTRRTAYWNWTGSGIRAGRRAITADAAWSGGRRGTSVGLRRRRGTAAGPRVAGPGSR